MTHGHSTPNHAPAGTFRNPAGDGESDGHHFKSLCAMPSLAQVLWEAYANMTDVERRIWVACMWRGESVLDVGRQQGLASCVVRLQLRETARAMDERLALAPDWKACAPRPAGTPADRTPAGWRLFSVAVEKQLRRGVRMHRLRLPSA